MSTMPTLSIRHLLILPLFLFFAAPASAQFSGPGTQETPTTVQTVLDNPQDDQPVTLRGRILEQVGDEKYAFTDDTGQIRIEIDDEVFSGQQITPDMEVEIYGEVEDDFMQDPEIDVERLTVGNAGSGQQGNPGRQNSAAQQDSSAAQQGGSSQ